MNSSGIHRAELGDLDRFVRKAIWRVRLERLRRAVAATIWLLLIAATVWTAALLWRPELALAAPIGLGFAAALLLMVADVALFWQVDAHKVLLRIDRQLGLADATVTSTELADEPRDDWRRRQLLQTIEDLKRRSWDQHWPRRWPRLTSLAAVTLTVFGALLLQCYFVEKAGAQPASAPFLQSQLQALEEVFKDWEEAQKKFDDPELRRALEELKPLREKMASGELKERDVLVALGRVEDKLEAARKGLEAQSLGPSAAELASAFEPLQGMSATAAALRREDFGQAEKLAGEMAAKLEQPDAAPPEGSQNQENQKRLENLAEKLEQRGNEAMSQALQQMQQGMKDGESKEMSGGLRGVQKALGNQAKRDAEKQRLSTQLAQMGQCKECL
nr:hypothetical protein [Verrucomicrobiota bacterium]